MIKFLLKTTSVAFGVSLVALTALFFTRKRRASIDKRKASETQAVITAVESELEPAVDVLSVKKEQRAEDSIVPTNLVKEDSELNSGDLIETVMGEDVDAEEKDDFESTKTVKPIEKENNEEADSGNSTPVEAPLPPPMRDLVQALDTIMDKVASKLSVSTAAPSAPAPVSPSYVGGVIEGWNLDAAEFVPTFSVEAREFVPQKPRNQKSRPFPLINEDPGRSRAPKQRSPSNNSHQPHSLTLSDFIESSTLPSSDSGLAPTSSELCIYGDKCVLKNKGCLRAHSLS